MKEVMAQVRLYLAADHALMQKELREVIPGAIYPNAPPTEPPKVAVERDRK